jgi:hypothetical protein
MSVLSVYWSVINLKLILYHDKGRADTDETNTVSREINFVAIISGKKIRLGRIG